MRVFDMVPHRTLIGCLARLHRTNTIYLRNLVYAIRNSSHSATSLIHIGTLVSKSPRKERIIQSVIERKESVICDLL